MQRESPHLDLPGTNQDLRPYAHSVDVETEYANSNGDWMNSGEQRRILIMVVERQRNRTKMQEALVGREM